ncbi:hypothetical protein HYPBUDRAFT_142326 [Hyphopichia burtonii NRRL Y-1933]|uniref:Uncharacterized protein n=1 Tax=Hyphopichia burtonii NRRL Y-1933 TaxID=984485 RepID=A0A1E4RFR8_9ASCO|nr:hypothetical protein HYPBUDRAFT_142326 [Hyphopichia burtonii NRRL Y-1933]ODV66098.1 hypothetical protein HYPBUDRAFT_142326 [Hyphopichia burtonii NRRL Y-1933]
MCKSAICSICHHKSWVGCGQHKESIMSITPKDQWCTCEALEGEGDEFPPKAGTGFARKTSSD